MKERSKEPIRNSEQEGEREREGRSKSKRGVALEADLVLIVLLLRSKFCTGHCILFPFSTVWGLKIKEEGNQIRGEIN